MVISWDVVPRWQVEVRGKAGVSTTWPMLLLLLLLLTVLHQNYQHATRTMPVVKQSFLQENDHNASRRCQLLINSFTLKLSQVRPNHWCLLFSCWCLLWDIFLVFRSVIRSSDKLFGKKRLFFQPPKKVMLQFFWGADYFTLVQLILFMQKKYQKTTFRVLFGLPPKMHYSAPQCSAMYCSVNASIIHFRWVKYDPGRPRMTDCGPRWHTRGQGAPGGPGARQGGPGYPLRRKEW